MQRQATLLALLLCLALVMGACGGASSPTATTGAAAEMNTKLQVTTAPAATAAPSGGANAATATTGAAAAEPTPIRIVDEGAEAPAFDAVATAAPTFGAASTGTHLDSALEENWPVTGVVGEDELVEPTAAPIEPTAAPIEQSVSPLKAGEVDDNADFTAYQSYLASYSGPPAQPVDVQERVMVTITNDQQQPVLDALVRVFEGERQVFEGRTYAGGKTMILPRTLGLSGQGALRVVVEKGGRRVEGTLSRSSEPTSSFSLVLPGARSLPAQPRLDVLFLLDATGSMSDEIDQIQRTIVSIAERIDALSPRPELRLALVAYRDRGEEYVTRGYAFTSDVSAFRKMLLEVNAAGGGDEPEALNEGLHGAIQGVKWADEALRLVFLVADAPPHLDYENDFSYVDEARTAVASGIKIFPIAASNTSEQAEYIFRQLAQQTLASFIFLTYESGQAAGPPGDSTVHNVDPSQFTVERLDDLVVQVVERELARAQGR